MPKNAVALAFATGLLFAAAPAASPIALAAGPTVKDIITNYGNVAEAMYSDSLVKAKDLDRWVDFKRDRQHAGMSKVSITGGYLKGEHAVVMFTGSSTSIDNLYGEAVLRREGGKWLFEDEWTDVGTRP